MDVRVNGWLDRSMDVLLGDLKCLAQYIFSVL